MLNQFTKSLAMVIAIAILSACTTEKLAYRIDPEIGNVQQLSKRVELVAVKVNDSRPDSPQGIKKDLIIASGPADTAEVLRKKLLDQLKYNQFKIINNPLLADLSLEFTIENLYATIETSMFKSEIKTVSEIRVKAKKQSKSYEKVYRNSRKQEVANPANENDVTGVINQMLSQQLSTIFADEKLVQLSEG